MPLKLTIVFFQPLQKGRQSEQPAEFYLLLLLLFIFFFQRTAGPVMQTLPILRGVGSFVVRSNLWWNQTDC